MAKFKLIPNFTETTTYRFEIDFVNSEGYDERETHNIYLYDENEAIEFYKHLKNISRKSSIPNLNLKSLNSLIGIWPDDWDGEYNLELFSAFLYENGLEYKLDLIED